ncbi:MAG: hypothetical protein GYA24_16330 [Candidatus Lokiarchaeota archaeon]|nr:hypothetical protein [Candidatus Lokiarchaeota archaeon]
MPTSEEQFILKTLADNKGEMGFKELNEKCADKFEGCRIILKKLKEQGLVSFDGAVPAFSGKIKLVKEADRALALKRVKEENAPTTQAHGAPTDATLAVLKLLKEKGGSASYKDIISQLGEHFEGLRLILKKMKDQDRIDYEGDLPNSPTIIKMKDG